MTTLIIRGINRETLEKIHIDQTDSEVRDIATKAKETIEFAIEELCREQNIYKVAMRGCVHKLFKYKNIAFNVFLVLMSIFLGFCLSASVGLIAFVLLYALNKIQSVHNVITTMIFIPYLIVRPKYVKKVGKESLYDMLCDVYLAVYFDVIKQSNQELPYFYYFDKSDFVSFIYERITPMFKDIKSPFAHLKLIKYAFSHDIYCDDFNLGFHFKKF